MLRFRQRGLSVKTQGDMGDSMGESLRSSFQEHVQAPHLARLSKPSRIARANSAGVNLLSAIQSPMADEPLDQDLPRHRYEEVQVSHSLRLSKPSSISRANSAGVYSLSTSKQSPIINESLNQELSHHNFEEEDHSEKMNHPRYSRSYNRQSKLFRSQSCQNVHSVRTEQNPALSQSRILQHLTRQHSEAEVGQKGNSMPQENSQPFQRLEQCRVEIIEHDSQPIQRHHLTQPFCNSENERCQIVPTMRRKHGRTPLAEISNNPTTCSSYLLPESRSHKMLRSGDNMEILSTTEFTKGPTPSPEHGFGYKTPGFDTRPTSHGLQRTSPVGSIDKDQGDIERYDGLPVTPPSKKDPAKAKEIYELHAPQNLKVGKGGKKGKEKASASGGPKPFQFIAVSGDMGSPASTLSYSLAKDDRKTTGTKIEPMLTAPILTRPIAVVNYDMGSPASTLSHSFAKDDRKTTGMAIEPILIPPILTNPIAVNYDMGSPASTLSHSFVKDDRMTTGMTIQPLLDGPLLTRPIALESRVPEQTTVESPSQRRNDPCSVTGKPAQDPEAPEKIVALDSPSTLSSTTSSIQSGSRGKTRLLGLGCFIPSLDDPPSDPRPTRKLYRSQSTRNSRQTDKSYDVSRSCTNLSWITRLGGNGKSERDRDRVNQGLSGYVSLKESPSCASRNGCTPRTVELSPLNDSSCASSRSGRVYIEGGPPGFTLQPAPISRKRSRKTTQKIRSHGPSPSGPEAANDVDQHRGWEV